MCDRGKRFAHYAYKAYNRYAGTLRVAAAVNLRHQLAEISTSTVMQIHL